MMAEKILEKEVCQACGADVRRNADFCYNCGAAVVEATDNTPKITSSLDEKAIPMPVNTPIVAQRVVEKLEASSKTEPRLKSAAEIRQINKSERKKSVEISWEEPASAPNVWFITVALILTLFAVGILFAMIYIR